MSIATVAAMPRLAVWHTALESLAVLRRERRRVLPALVALSLLFSFLQIPLSQLPSLNAQLFVSITVHLAVNAPLAYLWCRLVLLDEWMTDAGGGVRAPLTWIQFRGFFCYYALIGVGLVTLALILALGLVPSMGFGPAAMVSGLLFSLLVARFSFVFPAAAIQLPTSFIESWYQTTGQGLRLWGIYACANVPAAILVGGLALGWRYLPDSMAVSLVASFAGWFVGLTAMLVTVTAMSMAYDRIVGLPPRARRLDRMVGED